VTNATKTNGDKRATSTTQILQQPTEREAYVFGVGPRLNLTSSKEISTGLLAILRQWEGMDRALQSTVDDKDRGVTMDWRAQVLANPEAAAKSPEIQAELAKLPEIVGIMLRHADLFTRHTDVGLQLTRGALSLRHREFAVLRIAWLCQAPYEWGEHVRVGKRFGLTSEDIERIIEGPDAEALDELESTILRSVDELYDDAMISDATWNKLAKRLDERQLIELPIIVGHYQTVAYYQNSLRVSLHAGNLGLKAR